MYETEKFESDGGGRSLWMWKGGRVEGCVREG